MTAMGSIDARPPFQRMRYFLATRSPGAVRPENARAALRWLTIDQARDLVGRNNLRFTLDRAEELLRSAAPPYRPRM